MTNETLALGTRLWFAWLCFFRVLFDGAFAARLWQVREAPRLAPPENERARAPEADETPAEPAKPPVPPPAAEPPVTPALQLLALLQREGRLVDFLQQEIASFPDADIGVAARVVHEGCRKALRAHGAIEPIRAEAEGARVTLAPGFRADETKLVGDVKGQPPYAGVLRHRGWRATRLELPRIVGDHDASVLAPAEVELG